MGWAPGEYKLNKGGSTSRPKNQQNQKSDIKKTNETNLNRSAKTKKKHTKTNGFLTLHIFQVVFVVIFCGFDTGCTYIEKMYLEKYKKITSNTSKSQAPHSMSTRRDNQRKSVSCTSSERATLIGVASFDNFMSTFSLVGSLVSAVKGT